MPTLPEARGFVGLDLSAGDLFIPFIMMPSTDHSALWGSRARVVHTRTTMGDPPSFDLSASRARRKRLHHYDEDER